MQGDEYRTKNMYRCYPLADGQDVPELVKRLFASAYFVLDHGSTAVPTLTNVSVDVNDSGITSVSFTITDGNGTTLISSASPYSVFVSNSFTDYFGDRGFYYVGLSRLGGTNSKITDPGWVGIDERNWTGNLVFDPSTIEYDTERVDSVSFVNGDTTVLSCTSQFEILTNWDNPFIVNGRTWKDREFGYVTDTKYGRSFIKKDAVIEMQAELGGGDATRRFPQPMIISAKDRCIDIVQDPESNSVIFYNKCVACCQCSQYVERITELITQAQSLLALRQTFNTDLSKYNESVQNLNEEIGETENS